LTTITLLSYTPDLERVCAAAMLSLAKLVAPTIFESLSESNDAYIKERMEKIDKILEPIRKRFEGAKRGELIEVPLDTLPLHHTVKAYVRKV
jgi:hypothetical protein